MDPNINPILEICVVETDRTGRILRAFSSKCAPGTKTVDPEAAKVNGYTPEKWAGAPCYWDVEKMINRKFGQAEKYQPAGWNIWFDLGFWKEYLTQSEVKFDHHAFDILSAALIAIPGFSGRLSLSKAYLHFTGFDMPGAHTAEGDVFGMIELYKALLERARK